MRFRFVLALAFATLSSLAAAVIPPEVQTEVVEFYHKDLDHYFITTNPKEISDLDTGVHAGWVRTGFKFASVKIGSTQAATTPVCRFYGKPEAKIDSHFYSSKVAECDEVKAKFPDAWQFEADEVFRAFAVDPNTGQCPADTIPVFRLWNQRPDVNHRYTDQDFVYAVMVEKGYKAEGDGNPQQPVAFCTPAGGSTIPPAPEGSPVCQISASNGAPAVGSTITLTATCSNTPTSYTWAGCTSTTNTCTSTKAASGPVKYAVAATNDKGMGAPISVSVAWGGVGGGGPTPVCTVTTTNRTPASGSQVTLQASCTLSPSRYTWYECSYLVPNLCAQPITTCSATSSSCTVTSSTGEAKRYGVAGTNGTGSGSVSTVEVLWQGGGGGNPPPPPVSQTPTCSPTTSNPNPTVGQSITLTANCTNNPTSYTWTVPPSASCNGATCTESKLTAGAQTYFVSGTNSFGTGNSGAVQVTWSAPAVPVCTLTPSSTTPVAGSTITIQANCTGGPTQFSWTGCTSTTNSCSDTVSVAGAKQYTMVAANGSGTGAPATTLVNWQPPPTAAPSCTLSSSNPTPYTGQTITLTASCTQSPTSYVWTNCIAGPSSSTCQTTSSAVGQQSYSVTASNVQFGAGAPALTTVTWQQAVGGQDFCGSYQNVVRLSKSWGDNAPIYTYTAGNFAANGVVVVSFTAPSTPSYAASGSTQVAEFNGVPTFRQINISKSSCDFRATDPTGATGPYTMAQNSLSPQIFWNVGAPPVALTPGQTYYVNIRNWSDLIGITCSVGSCNAIIQFNWPH